MEDSVDEIIVNNYTERAERVRSQGVWIWS